jgi:glycogen debranching enzyme
LALLLPMNDNEIFNWDYFWTLGIEAVKELETERGILASARHELFGCIFGRDSLITSLQLLRVCQETGDPDFLGTVRKVLLTLADLQGRAINVESGEEPGKIIHEYRPDKHEHLTRPGGANGNEKPWYLYPDQIMRNYDTVDATPLFLIAVYRYIQLTQTLQIPDPEFSETVMPSVKAAIYWIFWYGDSNGDGFIDYQLKPERTFGGLQNQNWMDSSEATFHEDGTPVIYPIAPVEAQAYTYLALRLWGRYFGSSSQGKFDHEASEQLQRRADILCDQFNQTFITSRGDTISLASGIDGVGKLMTSVRSSMGHCLWAAMNPTDDGVLDGILRDDSIGPLVKRLLSPDMFEPRAGIRTLSTASRNYQPNSYHNGSIWPHDTNMIAEGMQHYGYTDEAGLVRIAMLSAVNYFKHPLELYVYDRDYADYVSPQGQRANQTQAWAAAAILSAVAPHKKQLS